MFPVFVQQYNPITDELIEVSTSVFNLIVLKANHTRAQSFHVSLFGVSLMDEVFPFPLRTKSHGFRGTELFRFHIFGLSE